MQYFSCLTSLVILSFLSILVVAKAIHTLNEQWEPSWINACCTSISLIPKTHVEKAGHHVHPCDPNAETEAEAGECLLLAGQTNILGEPWAKETLSDKNKIKGHCLGEDT